MSSLLYKVIGKKTLQIFRFDSYDKAIEHVKKLGFISMEDDEYGFLTKKKLAVVLREGRVHIYDRKDVGV